MVSVRIGLIFKNKIDFIDGSIQALACPSVMLSTSE